MASTFFDSPSLMLTSESVTEGHPDKLCDQISDAVLDALLEQDPYARVACEVAVNTGVVFVFGEITTSAWVDIPDTVRRTIREVGYDDSEDRLRLAHLRRHLLAQGAGGRYRARRERSHRVA